MPFEGSTEGKIRRRYGELAAQWLEQCRARLALCRMFPQCRHSVRNGGAVTGVCGRDSGHSHCGGWRPGAVRPGRCGGVVGINASVQRAGDWKDRLSFPSRGGLEQDGDVLLARGQARYPRARRRRCASLSPFLFSRSEGGCRPSWTWLPSICLHF